MEAHVSAALIDLFMAAETLQRTERSGYIFLGSGSESVADHSFLTAIIGFALSGRIPGVDRAHITLMCLLHDLPEAYTGDLNYVYKKYQQPNLELVLSNMLAQLPDGDLWHACITEFEAGQTQEAKLAKDADQLAMLVKLRCQEVLGNQRATSWMEATCRRLHSSESKYLAQAICQADPDRWWVLLGNADWWVHGGKKSPSA